MTINVDCCLVNNFGKKTNKDQLINSTKQRKIKANIGAAFNHWMVSQPQLRARKFTSS